MGVSAAVKPVSKWLLAGGAVLLAGFYLGCGTGPTERRKAVHKPSQPKSAISGLVIAQPRRTVTTTESRAPGLMDLSSPARRQEYYDALLDKDTVALWALWNQFLDQDDPNASMAWLLIGEALSLRLREQPDPDTLEAIAAALNAADASPALRQQLPLIVARAATPETLSLLIDKVINETDLEQRRLYQEAIETAANTQWGQRFHPELSPPLEAAWSEQWLQQDPEVLNTLALAIARIGAPDGVNLLLDTLASGGASIEEIEAARQPHVLAAVQALASVRNPDAAALLRQRMEHSQPENPVFLASGNALANIGGPAATQALLDWAQNATAETSDLARRWFSRLRDNRSIALAQARLANKQPFRSEQIRSILESSLDAVRNELRKQLP